MNKPLISVITPVFNSEKTISETIESVINQTYSNWELIDLGIRNVELGVGKF